MIAEASSMPRAASRYETLMPIGAGGMATVFVARALGAVGFQRLVALKRPHAHIRGDAALAASMKLEARVASRLHHANVVSVLDVEEEDGDLVLVLDYVEGCTLRTLMTELVRLEERRPREMLRIVLDAAAGLHAAHGATDENGRRLGLVHRDVTPSNVLVGVDGVARLSDFGIAKALYESTERTETGVLKGKAAYMAPEYVVSHEADASSDLFSFAVVVWEALAGSALFKGPSQIETLKRIARADVPPLSRVRPELAFLDPLFARALARIPADRYASVEIMAAELEALARANDLVATHGEVAALVQRIAAPELAERRRRLHEGGDTVVASRPPAASARDDIATKSMQAFSSAAIPEAREARTFAPAPEKRARLLPVAGLALLALATLSIGWIWTPRPHPQPDPAPSVALPSAVQAPIAPVSIEPTPAPAASSPARAAKPPPASPAKRLTPRKAPPNPYGTTSP